MCLLILLLWLWVTKVKTFLARSCLCSDLLSSPSQSWSPVSTTQGLYFVISIIYLYSLTNVWTSVLVYLRPVTHIRTLPPFVVFITTSKIELILFIFWSYLSLPNTLNLHVSCLPRQFRYSYYSHVLTHVSTLLLPGSPSDYILHSSPLS